MLIPILFTGLTFWLSAMFWIMSAAAHNATGMVIYGLLMIILGVILKIFIKG